MLGDEYRLFDRRTSRLHNRDLTHVIVESERGMSARWTFRILSVRGDTVTAGKAHRPRDATLAYNVDRSR
jgi:hypothetical protein